MKKKLSDWAERKGYNWLALIIEEPIFLYYFACIYWLWIQLWFLVVLILPPNFIDEVLINLAGQMVLVVSIFLHFSIIIKKPIKRLANL